MQWRRSDESSEVVARNYKFCNSDVQVHCSTEFGFGLGTFEN